MKYTRHLNYHKRKRFLFRLRLFFVVIIVLIISAAAWVYYSVIFEEQSNTIATSTSQESSAYFTPSNKVLRSSYFQLQTDKTWSEIPTESNANKFVYRSFKGNLIEHELVIYVNQIPTPLNANRVLPVNLKGESELLPLSVSEHCMKTAGGSRIDNPLVTMGRVKFGCDADSTDYSVLIGLADGSTSFFLKRPDGSAAAYAMRYTNLRAVPDSAQLNEIVSNFQTR